MGGGIPFRGSYSSAIPLAANLRWIDLEGVVAELFSGNEVRPHMIGPMARLGRKAVRSQPHLFQIF